MLVYSVAERRIMIIRDGEALYFAGGTFDTFLIPQTDDGFGLASVVSYTTGLRFETRETKDTGIFVPRTTARALSRPNSETMMPDVYRSSTNRLEPHESPHRPGNGRLFLFNA